MTKPGNSGPDEPKPIPDPEPATVTDPETPAGATPVVGEPADLDGSGSETPAGAKPVVAEPAESDKPAESDTADTTDTGAEKPAVNPDPAPNPNESPIGTPGGPPVSNATAEDRQSDAVAAEAVDNSDVVDNSADEPVAAAKPVKAKRTAKDRAVVDEPLMAELEKAPPPPEEPVMPTAREEAARRQATRRFEEPAPRTLRISLYFFVAAGLVWLISMIASLVLKQQLIDQQIKLNKDPKLTPEQIANGVTQILWIVLVAALTFTVFLALFGYKATEGTRRARTLVTIFSVVLVLFHLLLNGTPAGILSAMFALVGLALLWSPSARGYFAPRELR